MQNVGWIFQLKVYFEEQAPRQVGRGKEGLKDSGGETDNTTFRPNPGTSNSHLLNSLILQDSDWLGTGL